MSTPKHDQTEVLKIINKVAKDLAPHYIFGYHTLSDITQQCRLFAWQAMEKYDNKHSLYKFLYIHVRYRMISYRRDNYFRAVRPCHNCAFYDAVGDGCNAFADKMECPLFVKWYIRNTNKKNLSNLDILDFPELIVDNDSDVVVEEVSKTEMVDKINNNLPSEFRSDYLKLVAGAKLPRARYETLKRVMANILGFDDQTDTEDG
jgi:DNA-directed RNA polymerase specialized sigma24 family protein